MDDPRDLDMAPDQGQESPDHASSGGWYPGEEEPHAWTEDAVGSDLLPGLDPEQGSRGGTGGGSGRQSPQEGAQARPGHPARHPDGLRPAHRGRRGSRLPLLPRVHRPAGLLRPGHRQRGRPDQARPVRRPDRPHPGQRRRGGQRAGLLQRGQGQPAGQRARAGLLPGAPAHEGLAGPGPAAQAVLTAADQDHHPGGVPGRADHRAAGPEDREPQGVRAGHRASRPISACRPSPTASRRGTCSRPPTKSSRRRSPAAVLKAMVNQFKPNAQSYRAARPPRRRAQESEAARHHGGEPHRGRGQAAGLPTGSPKSFTTGSTRT